MILIGISPPKATIHVTQNDVISYELFFVRLCTLKMFG